MQKGFVGIIVLIVVLILAGLGGAYYFGRSQSVKTASQNPIVVSQAPQATLVPTSIPDETAKPGSIVANWKTYLSDDKSFSFKYPSEWIFETKSTKIEIQGKKYDANSIIGGLSLTEEQRKAQGYININDAPKTYRNFTLVYSTSPDFKDLTLDNLVGGFIKATNIDFNKNIKLDNNAIAREVGYGCQADCRDILFQHNNTIFDSSTGPNADANISTLRQILSTFKFTN